jgi:4-hydroxy-3-methylbut-2-enyl diphosphate reductase
MSLVGIAIERILVCRPRGFCAGVGRAIEIVDLALKTWGPPIYVRGEIVHNRRVLDDFRSRGVFFVNAVSDVPDGSLLIFSAHGVSPQVREEASRRELRLLDATCPLVTKVHREARWMSSKGMSVLLIGHAGHDEVIGIAGEVGAHFHLITGVEDAKSVEVEDPKRVGFLCQTTLSVSDAASILAVLRERFPDGVTPPKEDICYATQNRQEAVREVAGRADLFLIVGSANSSNSNRMREVAESAGIPAYLIENKSCLRTEWLKGVRRVGLSSGASVPEVLVQELVDLLKSISGAVVEEIETAVEKVSFVLNPQLISLKPAAKTFAGP